MEALIILVRYILLYTTLIGGSIFISLKLDRKIERCIAPNFFITAISMYILGIIGIIQYGIWVVVILNLLLGIYALIRYKEKIQKNILTVGMAFFSIMFVILLITTYNKALVDYDHYSYRSIDVKTMFYTNKILEGNVKTYPPITKILEYTFMKIIGIYYQGMEAFTLQMLGFSIFLPLFDKKKNDKLINIIISMIILCVPAILANLVFYEAAYPDALLGILVGYSFYVLITEEDNKFKLFTVILALMVTTLTKPSGFYIAIIVLGMYAFIELLYNKNKGINKIKSFVKSQAFKNLVLLFLTITITIMSWKVYIKVNSQDGNATIKHVQDRVTKDDNSKITYLLKNIMMTTFGYYEENHDSADCNLDLTTKIYALYTTMAPVRLTLYGTICAIMILSIISYKFVVTEEKKELFKNTIISLTAGLVAYIVFLQLSYLFIFSKAEMLEHAGLNRYLPTFLLGMIYVIITMVMDNIEIKGSKKSSYILLLAVIIAFTPLSSIFNITITSGISNIKAVEYCNNGRIPAMQIDENIEENEEIMVISQKEDTNLFALMTRYYLYPNHKTLVYTGLSEAGAKDLINVIRKQNIKYIYFYNSDSVLNSKLNKGNLIEDESLYKVSINNEEIEMTKVEINK